MPMAVIAYFARVRTEPQLVEPEKFHGECQYSEDAHLLSIESPVEASVSIYLTVPLFKDNLALYHITRLLISWLQAKASYSQLWSSAQLSQDLQLGSRKLALSDVHPLMAAPHLEKICIRSLQTNSLRAMHLTCSCCVAASDQTCGILKVRYLVIRTQQAHCSDLAAVAAAVVIVTSQRQSEHDRPTPQIPL